MQFSVEIVRTGHFLSFSEFHQRQISCHLEKLGSRPRPGATAQTCCSGVTLYGLRRIDQTRVEMAVIIAAKASTMLTSMMNKRSPPNRGAHMFPQCSE
jgi:hypothetical protein